MTTANTPVKLTLEFSNLEQVLAVADALELLSRVSMGQLSFIGEMVCNGEIPTGPEKDGSQVSRESVDFVDALLRQAKAELGYASNSNWSIGAKQVPVRAKRAWETLKVLRKALAEHREPTPQFRGVDYDGVIVRYTQDELPKAEITS